MLKQAIRLKRHLKESPILLLLTTVRGDVDNNNNDMTQRKVGSVPTSNMTTIKGHDNCKLDREYIFQVVAQVFFATKWISL
jgi:hypothetical protein